MWIIQERTFERVFVDIVRCVSTAVDGGNPAPVNTQKIPFLIGVYSSQVVQDFFHQQ